MSQAFYQSASTFIRDLYSGKDFIPLHEPSFSSVDKKYLSDVIDSTFVSSAGEYINEFESQILAYTNAKKAIAVVNGTAALHLALIMSGVTHKDIVITQSLTFVATVNAIKYQNAKPLFIDVSRERMSLCPKKLSNYLDENAYINSSDICCLKESKQPIKALIVMHTFGHPADMNKIAKICKKWNIVLIEDSAESLGSFFKGKHTGTFGDFGTLSFNGNKIITTGGGGMLLCKKTFQGDKARHLATTAKARDIDFYHDEIGYNYRMPNINAALGCAQFSYIDDYLKSKRKLAKIYDQFFKDSDFFFFKEPNDSSSNYWLNTLLAPNKIEKNKFINFTNTLGIQTRPSWYLMHKLPIFKDHISDKLENTEWLSDRIINIPSSPNTQKI